jgi:hypothetical protein
MQARKAPEPVPTSIQMSLRIRHPAIDPVEISTSLGLEPEHCFKAGDSRSGRAKGGIAGRHTQTYWLAPVTAESWADPIEPSFLEAIAARRPELNFAGSAQSLQAAAKNLRYRSVEALLLHFLQRLKSSHSFLKRIQTDGGDIALIMVVERESAADFTLPVTLTRLLVQLGIFIEFKFDS